MTLEEILAELEAWRKEKPDGRRRHRMEFGRDVVVAVTEADEGRPVGVRCVHAFLVADYKPGMGDRALPNVLYFPPGTPVGEVLRAALARWRELHAGGERKDGAA